MNNNVELLEYLQWADSILSETIIKANSEDLTRPITETSGSIKEKLKHIVEEYIAWLYDIKSESWNDIIAKVQKMEYLELLAQMKSTLEEWVEFVQSPELNQFEIDEGDFKVPISLESVVFNLVNHSSYHRGQIILFLRSFGYEVTITDYYWYRIGKLNLNN